MRLLDFFRAGRAAVDIVCARGAGFGLRQNGVRLPLIVARDRNGQHLILREVILDFRVLQQTVQRVGIIEKAHIERLGQHVAVLADAVNRDHLVKPVDRQFDRRVDIDADGAGGGEVGPVARAAGHHQRKAGKSRCHAPRRARTGFRCTVIVCLPRKKRVGRLP